MAETEKRCKV